MLRAGTEGLATVPRIKSAGPGRPRRRSPTKGLDGTPEQPSGEGSQEGLRPVSLGGNLLEEGPDAPFSGSPSKRPEGGLDPSVFPGGEGLSSEEAQDLAVRRALIRDEALMAMIIEGVMEMHEEEGLALTPRELGRHSARIYADLIRAYALPEERIVGVRALLYQLHASLSRDSSGLISPPTPPTTPPPDPETA